MMMPHTIIYNWHPKGGNHYFCGLPLSAIGLLVTVVGVFQFSKPAFIGGAVFLLPGFFCFVEQQSRIDTKSQTLIREGRFLGRIRLWFIRRPLNEFVSVICCRVDEVGGTSQFFIGLRRKNGRNLYVCHLNAAGEQAIFEGHKLAKILQLPFEEI